MVSSLYLGNVSICFLKKISVVVTKPGERHFQTAFFEHQWYVALKGYLVRLLLSELLEVHHMYVCLFMSYCEVKCIYVANSS